MSNPRRPDPPGDDLWVCQLGTVDYRDGLAIQEDVRERRQAGLLGDVLLLLEHPPVLTRGRRAAVGELLHEESFYLERGIELIDCDRGGKITYHGPGQLVGYPIMAAGDVGRYVRLMESAIIAALAGAGVPAHARAQDGPDYTGVWAGARKIASIGVHIQRGISTHGFAVNVCNDLTPFSWVVACGLADVEMTSLERERERERARGEANSACASEAEPMDCLRRRVAYEFCRAHGRRQRLVTPGRLGLRAGERTSTPEAVPA